MGLKLTFYFTAIFFAILISFFSFFKKEYVIPPVLSLSLLHDRFEKRVRYASRKARADVRKRVKGRFVKAGDAYDYDPLAQTRSC